jgi:hypothetical protein
MTSTNDVSIFSNRDRSELIVAVDHGPIYRSTNSGMTWKSITEPGLHKFPLSTTLDGGGLYAHVPIDRPYSPNIVAGTNAVIPDWYAVASSSDGSQVVVTTSSPLKEDGDLHIMVERGVSIGRATGQGRNEGKNAIP